MIADIPVYSYNNNRPQVEPTASPVGSLLDNVTALQQGLETGLKVPTIAGAIGQGITSAVDTASKLALQDAQTQNLTADAAYKNAQVSKLLSGPTDQEIADLKYKQAETTKITQENQGQTDFQNAITKLGGAAPGDIPNMFNDPSIIGPLTKNWKEGGAAQAGLALARSGNDPGVKNVIDGIKTASYEGAQNDIFQKINNGLVTQGLTSLADGVNTGLWNRLGAQVDPSLNPAQLVQRLQSFPQGQKSFDPNTGEMQVNKADGTPGSENKGKWDIYDPINKKLITTLEDSGQNKEATTFLNTKKGLGIHFDNLAQISGLSGTPPVSLTSQGSQMQPQATSQTAPPSTGPTNLSNVNTNIVPPQPGLSTTQSAIAQKQNYWAQQARTLSNGSLPSPVTAPSIQTAPPTQTPISTPTPTTVPTPQDNLTQATGKPVTLNLPPTPSIKPQLYHSISTNPLLQNEPAIIKGFASQESKGDVNAVSPTGVKGLLQVTQSTAAQYGFDRDIPAQQVQAAKAFIADMYQGTNYYKNSPLNGNLPLVAAAYNAGPGLIEHAVKQTGSTYWPTVRDYLSTILSKSKFNEVKDYPERVLNASAQFVNPSNRADQTLVSNFAMNGLIS